MNEKVSVFLSVCRMAGGEKEEQKEEYSGRLRSTPDGWKLRYMTRGEQGNLHTILTFSSSRMILENQGTMERRLSFVPGERTKTEMKFSFGTMIMEIDTEEYHLIQQGRDYKIVLIYDLYHGRELTSHHRMEIIIKRSPI
jgi:uncharacterized beta-barrel protein YwiB (DUF1934 family)